jgi:hypothetical protein
VKSAQNLNAVTVVTTIFCTPSWRWLLSTVAIVGSQWAIIYSALYSGRVYSILIDITNDLPVLNREKKGKRDHWCFYYRKLNKGNITKKKRKEKEMPGINKNATEKKMATAGAGE